MSWCGSHDGNCRCLVVHPKERPGTLHNICDRCRWVQAEARADSLQARVDEVEKERDEAAAKAERYHMQSITRRHKLEAAESRLEQQRLEIEGLRSGITDILDAPTEFNDEGVRVMVDWRRRLRKLLSDPVEETR